METGQDCYLEPPYEPILIDDTKYRIVVRLPHDKVLHDRIDHLDGHLSYKCLSSLRQQEVPSQPQMP